MGVEARDQDPAEHFDESAARRLRKSPEAYRTISEVAAELEVPTHVLRFWESKFPQLRPIKRGGGRRYYRPQDVELLGRIRLLLHRDGYTIKGAQRLLRGGDAGERPDPAARARSRELAMAASLREAADAVSASFEAGEAMLDEPARARILGVIERLEEVSRALRRAAAPDAGRERTSFAIDREARKS